MASTKKIVFTFATICVIAVSGYREELRRTISGCKNGAEVTDQELEEIEKPLIPANEEERCLVACVFKTFNVIGEGNTFDKRIALAVMKDVLKDHPEKLAKMQAVADHCGDEIPKQMANECDLAGEIMNCYVKWEKEEHPEEVQSRLFFNAMSGNSDDSAGSGLMSLLLNIPFFSGFQSLVVRGLSSGLSAILGYGRSLIFPRPSVSSVPLPPPPPYTPTPEDNEVYDRVIYE